MKIDTDKVLAGLKACVSPWNMCNECPYNGSNDQEFYCDRNVMLKDAIRLIETEVHVDESEKAAY